MSGLCECGCGEPVGTKQRFVRGHWSRSPESKAMRAKMRKAVEPPNPSGLCMCGCGELTPVATTSKPFRGYRAGDHVRYIPGHQVKEGEGNPRWKGGRWVHKGGYVYVYAPEHPKSNRDGYVYEHRLVMEQTLGRVLTSEERVHHLNGIKTDNRPENLSLLPNQSAHNAIHGVPGLTRYHQEHPEATRESGRKGAAARWGRVHRLEQLLVAILLDDEVAGALRAYVHEYGGLPESEDALGAFMTAYGQAEGAHDPPPA